MDYDTAVRAGRVRTCEFRGLGSGKNPPLTRTIVLTYTGLEPNAEPVWYSHVIWDCSDVSGVQLLDITLGGIPVQWTLEAPVVKSLPPTVRLVDRPFVSLSGVPLVVRFVAHDDAPHIVSAGVLVDVLVRDPSYSAEKHVARELALQRRDAQLDLERLYKLLDAHRTHHDLSWRQVAKTTSVPASTYTRLKTRTQAPSADALVAMLAWLDWPSHDLWVRSTH